MCIGFFHSNDTRRCELIDDQHYKQVPNDSEQAERQSSLYLRNTQDAKLKKSELRNAVVNKCDFKTKLQFQNISKKTFRFIKFKNTPMSIFNFVFTNVLLYSYVQILIPSR